MVSIHEMTEFYKNPLGQLYEILKNFYVVILKMDFILIISKLRTISGYEKSPSRLWLGDVRYGM
jgi:hypothetical protein